MNTDNTKKEEPMTKWFTVVNTPGVDIRHTFNGLELALVEHCNRQIADKIVRAVNAHDALVEALKAADEILGTCGFQDIQPVRTSLRKALALAEGK